MEKCKMITISAAAAVTFSLSLADSVSLSLYSPTTLWIQQLANILSMNNTLLVR
jgi:hypothetical protein